ALATVQPSSAAVARPVLQRHRSMANCRASATAIFFLSDAPTLSFSKYFFRACQPGCQRNSRQTDFYQQHPDMFVAMTVDCAKALHAAATVFARAAASVAAYCLAMEETFPIAHFSIDQ